MAVDLRGFYLKVRRACHRLSGACGVTVQHPHVALDMQCPCAAGPIFCCAGGVCARANLPTAVSAARSGGMLEHPSFLKVGVSSLSSGLLGCLPACLPQHRQTHRTGLLTQGNVGTQTGACHVSAGAAHERSADEAGH